ncbi:APC family permease [Nocardioides caldifontis]|uniref:APC family permease n=1 Tax=Nocardioides caldifontis TaxID=2588938 RepID=UPI0011DF4586|nr:APC family permease [Nocardioides caldifontis]
MVEHTAAADVPKEEGTSELKRVMGPKLLLLFIVGDILGAGVYAVTGDIAAQVGGMAWLPFLLAFTVAGLTALAYLELVTKYPQAAGAALYAHKAFGLHFVTFLVAFAVVCSGITSASTSSGLLASNLLIGLDRTVGDDGGLEWFSVPTGETTAVVVALLFILLLALINLRGVNESVKFNVVLTLVELLALAIVIAIGFYAMARNGAEPSRVVEFTGTGDVSAIVAVTIATAIAFFSMVGFEDSVNMVEETRDPRKVFPRAMLTGLGIAVVIYMLVAVAVVMVLSLDEIAEGAGTEEGVLLTVVTQGLPDFPAGTIFPFLTVFAVANTALINMLMASRLIYGMARQDVLPRHLGSVLPGRRSPWTAIAFTTSIALVLIVVVSQLADSSVTALSGTTGLLLLCVFTVVNVAALVLRRDDPHRESFRAPTFAPVLGAVFCAYLIGPWARTDEQMIQYRIAGVMILVGVALWLFTWFVNRRIRHTETGFKDVEHLDS